MEEIQNQICWKVLLNINRNAVKVLVFFSFLFLIWNELKDSTSGIKIIEEQKYVDLLLWKSGSSARLFSFISTGKELMENEVKEHTVQETRSSQSNVRYKRPVLSRGTQHVMDQHPHLIQRMESGYESSERNSNSPVSLDIPLSESSSTHR